MKKLNLFLIDEKELTTRLGQELAKQPLSFTILGTAETHEEACEKLSNETNIDIIVTNECKPNVLHTYKKNWPQAKLLLLLRKGDTVRMHMDEARLVKPFKLDELVGALRALGREKEKKDATIENQFKALADGTRRAILDALTERTHTAGELANRCQTTKPNISQHLKILKASGLVQEEKKGLYVYYSLSSCDFRDTKKEVGKVLTIKEKILYDIQQLAYKKNCEPVVGATDSQDDGTLYMMKNAETLISFHYSFRLNVFVIRFEIPAYLQKGGNYEIRYDDQQAIEELYKMLNDELLRHIETKTKETEIYKKIHIDLLNHMTNKTRHLNLLMTKDKEVLSKLAEWMDAFITNQYPDYDQSLQLQIIKEEVQNELTSLGKIQPYMDDTYVNEILINEPNDVWVEQQGKLTKTNVTFTDHDELMRFARKIAEQTGRQWDTSFPFLQTKLPDGSNVHIVLPPVAARGVTIAIRKCSSEPLTMHDLLQMDVLSEEMAHFLECAVKARTNILVSGATGVGKSTIINVLSRFIPNDERIVTIENSRELQLIQEHVVRLETRPPNQDGSGGVNTRECIKAACLVRPDRILVNEIHDAAAFQIVEAVKLGYDGVITSVHGATVEAALKRYLEYINYTGHDFSINDRCNLIEETFDLIVHVTRLKDGTRKISEISKIICSHEEMHTIPLFERKETEKGEEVFACVGTKLSKNLADKFNQMNITNPLEKFMQKRLEKEVSEVEKELPNFIDDLADIIQSGLSLTEAFRYVHQQEKTNLTTRFYKVVEDTDVGIETVTALEKLKQPFFAPQYHLFLYALCIQVKTSVRMESILRTIGEIIEERNQWLQGHSREEKKAIYASEDWQWMEFLDLLTCIAPTSSSLIQAIDHVHTYVDNRFSEAFQIATEEIRVGKETKKAFLDASQRVNHPHVRQFVKKMNQAETFGSGVEQTIVEHATKWRVTMKETILRNRH